MIRWSVVRNWCNDALSIVYPRVCEVCGRSLMRYESVLCRHCLDSLPRTQIHGDDFNLIHERLAGKVPIERAGAYFYYYRESPYAQLIHKAKYNSRPRIAKLLGLEYTYEISQSGFFKGIDLMLPVPLHWWKHIQRGYNQSEAIAQGIEKATGIPIGDNLVARRGHSSQTAKGAYSRWKNTEDVFAVRNADELAGKHVLVVDDVITTGATLLRCCEAIHKASPTTRISVLTLAAARD